MTDYNKQDKDPTGAAIVIPFVAAVVVLVVCFLIWAVSR
jgi:hypothetical protein